MQGLLFWFSLPVNAIYNAFQVNEHIGYKIV